MFRKKGVLKNFAKFTGKHLCQRLFLNKVAGCFFYRTPPVAACEIHGCIHLELLLVKSKATGTRAAFFIHTQQKNAATFFFGKCYSWRLLATCCNFRLLQQKNDATFLQQNQISLILLQFICNIFVVLHAAHFFSPQHIFSWPICAAYLCSKCYCDFIIDIYL